MTTSSSNSNLSFYIAYNSSWKLSPAQRACCAAAFIRLTFSEALKIRIDRETPAGANAKYDLIRYDDFLYKVVWEQPKAECLAAPVVSISYRRLSTDPGTIGLALVKITPDAQKLAFLKKYNTSFKVKESR